MDIRGTLASHGYALVKDGIPNPLLRDFADTLAHFIKAQAEQCGGQTRAQVRALAPEHLPHQGLIHLRNHSAEAMRQVVDRMKISPTFFALIHAPEVRRAAAHVLGLHTAMDVLASHPNFRADLPDRFAEEKRKFALPWHQEGAYYKTKASQSQSLVLHISLFDCSAEHGALELKEGSHLKQYLAHNEYFADETAKKHFRVELNDADLEGLKTVPLVSKAGDIGVIDFRTFHRSGQNTSDQVRYTFLIRVSPANAPDLVI